jgi:hypothetical protein
VSAALGADQPTYWATPSADGAVRLRNSALGLEASVATSGVSVSGAAGVRFGFGAPSVTRGATTEALAPMTAPAADRNRVTLVAGSLQESLTNGPAGIEQSFVVAHRVPGAGALVISQATSGDAVSGSAGGAITIGSGRDALSYRDLVVTDASGHEVPASLAVGAGQVRIMIDDSHAAYPLRIDPLIAPVEQQGGEKFVGNCTSSCTGPKGTGESGDGYFGWSVALSAAGNTALIGAYTDNGNKGAAWVFTRSGTTWSQQGEKLVGDCESSCGGAKGTGESGEGYFGWSVALSAEGNTALIGGYADSSDKGAAWVFTRSGTTWSQQGEKLVGDCTSSCTGAKGTGESGNGDFGYNVAVSAAGNTALISAYADASNKGAAWVFTRSGTTWSQQGEKLVGDCTSSCTGAKGTGESGEGYFGWNVALSAAGNTALIGAYADASNKGAAWVFTRSGTTWSQQGEKLVGD